MYKIMLLGEIKTGKTSFLHYLTKENQKQQDRIPLNHYPTPGVQVGVKTIEFNKSQYVNLQIWDTTGNHNYHSICQKFYHDMNGFIILVDLTNKYSLDDMNYWLQKIKHNKKNNDYFIGVIANKSDTSDKKFGEGLFKQKYALEDIKFYKQISLKNGDNVDEVIKKLGMQACKDKPNKIIDNNNNIIKQDKQQNQTCNCIII